MKKLVIVMALIIASAMVHAATFKWTATNVYASNGTSKYSGQALLYAYLSGAEASTAVKVATGTVDAGTIKDGTNTGLVFSTDQLEAGNKYNFYMVIEDNGKSFTSSPKTDVSAQATATSTVGFGSLATATQNASNWAPVPEPTSALLLMLGVAGLALKRKRV